MTKIGEEIDEELPNDKILRPTKNSQKTTHLQAYKWKAGQSGNPGGRPAGKYMLSGISHHNDNSALSVESKAVGVG